MSEGYANNALAEQAMQRTAELERWAKALAPSKQRKEKQKVKQQSVFRKFFGL